MNKYIFALLISCLTLTAQAQQTSTVTASVSSSVVAANSARMQSTAQLLNALQKLPQVDIDKDLLLWGFSYSLEAGTGDEAGQPVQEIPAMEPESEEASDAEGAGALRSALRVAQEGGGEGEFEANRDPTRFGLNNQGDFVATIPLFAAARTTIFSERRTTAYQLDADVLVEFTPAYQGEFGATFSMGFNDLRASGKKYFGETTSAFFLSGGLATNGATVRYGNDMFTYTAPMSLTGGIGMGRILNIEPRLRLLKLERMLQEVGVIKKSIPHAVGRDIMIAWWALKNERGYDQRMLHTLKIIHAAGLMVKAPNVGHIYRFGQIFNDTQLVTRRYGFEAEVRGRLGFTLNDSVDATYTLIPEASYKQVINKSYDQEITLEPIIGYALDMADRNMNTLPSASLAIPSSILRHDIVISLPVSWATYRYDEYYNRTGKTTYSVRASTGLNSDEDADLALTFSSNYSVFRSANTAINFGLNINAIKPGMGDLAFSLLATASYEIGAAESYYVAPVSLSEQLPIELPLPLPEYANIGDIFR